MSCLADTNILLRYVQPNHEMHADASTALDSLLRNGEMVAIVPQNLTGFGTFAHGLPIAMDWD